MMVKRSKIYSENHLNENSKYQILIKFHYQVIHQTGYIYNCYLTNSYKKLNTGKC